jgi:hypothetical protein
MKTLQNSGVQGLLNQGAFADAKKRQSAWVTPAAPLEPIQVAGNIHQDQQLLDMNRGTLPANARQLAPLPAAATDTVLPQLKNLPKGTIRTPKELEIIRAEQARQEEMLGLGPQKLNTRPGETEDQRNRRLHPELY